MKFRLDLIFQAKFILKLDWFLFSNTTFVDRHCVKSVQIRSNFWSVFSPNAGKYGPEITPYLDTFLAVRRMKSTAANSIVPVMLSLMVYDLQLLRANQLSQWYGDFNRKITPLIQKLCRKENEDALFGRQVRLKTFSCIKTRFKTCIYFIV